MVRPRRISRSTQVIAGVKNPQALKALEKSSIVRARQVLYAENPALTSNLYAAIDRAAQELESIPLNEIKELQAGDAARIEKIRRLKEAIHGVEQYIGKN